MFEQFQIKIVSVLCLFFLVGCSVGHNDYVDFSDDIVGKKVPYKEPFKFKNAGEYSRGNFAINGQGFTHITKDKSGNFIYHISDQEILSNYHTKEFVGKCLIYYVVDPKTFIIKSWGFDKGGNPLSCRTWP